MWHDTFTPAGIAGITLAAAVAWAGSAAQFGGPVDSDSDVPTKRSSKQLRSSEQLSCEIEVFRSNGSVELQALVIAPRTTLGRYRLRVAKSGVSGTSEISQSGDFRAVGDGPTLVTRVTLDSSGHYRARLAVTADGRTVECTDQIRGGI
jgi:hypothetical protein